MSPGEKSWSPEKERLELPRQVETKIDQILEIALDMQIHSSKCAAARPTERLRCHQESHRQKEFLKRETAHNQLYLMMVDLILSR